MPAAWSPPPCECERDPTLPTIHRQGCPLWTAEGNVNARMTAIADALERRVQMLDQPWTYARPRDSQWRTSQKGNPYISIGGAMAVVFPVSKERYRYIITDERSGGKRYSTFFRTQEEAMQEAQDALQVRALGQPVENRPRSGQNSATGVVTCVDGTQNHRWMVQGATIQGAGGLRCLECGVWELDVRTVGNAKKQGKPFGGRRIEMEP